MILTLVYRESVLMPLKCAYRIKTNAELAYGNCVYVIIMFQQYEITVGSN